MGNMNSPKKIHPRLIGLLVLIVAAAAAVVTFEFSYCGSLVCNGQQTQQEQASSPSPSYSISPAPVRVIVPEITGTSSISQMNPSINSKTQNSKTTTPSHLKIGNTDIKIEYAVTEAEQEHGLSDRSSLDQNSGMLFVLSTPSYQGMWMKDMSFSLDMVWIDQNMKIVDIKKNLSPATYPDTFTPQAEASYVLEVNAGFTDLHAVQIGQYISFES